MTDLTLTAGPLTLAFDPGTGAVRQVRQGGVEVLRGIYVALRDHNWNTVPGTLSDLTVVRGDRAFQVTFTVRHRQPPITFDWRGTLSGTPEGSVRYVFDGEAGSDFQRNRIGFCVLHPLRECVGQPCETLHSDGTTAASRFPRAICPQQPFRNLRGLRSWPSPGLQAEVTFEGDVFETEDQRNWTDASFKTYCTPLDLPFPVTVRAGARLHQAVTLRVAGRPPRLQDSGPREHSWPEASRPVPAIGFALPAQPPLHAAQRDKLLVLNPAHLRADLHFASEWRPHLRAAARLGVPLELALHLQDPERDLNALAAAWPEGAVARVLVFETGRPTASRHALQLARRVLPRVPLVGGTDAFFAELNRNRPDPQLVDGVTYSLNPQVHAGDDRSLFETLEAQGDTVRTARTFMSGRPVVLSPITLRMRFNPNATAPEALPPPGALPGSADPRQATNLAAAWTVGTLAALTEAGAAALTFFETHGDRGLMPGDAPHPQLPPGPDGTYPVYHVFAALADHRAGRAAARCCGPVHGLLLHTGDRRRWLFANTTPQPQQLLVPPGAGRWRVRHVTREPALIAGQAAWRSPAEDPTSVGGGAPLTFGPYGVVALDQEGVR